MSSFSDPDDVSAVLDNQIDTLSNEDNSSDFNNQIKLIRLYLPWTIVVPGLIGNLFILMIFLKKSRRFTSNGICFSALAITDSFALIFMLLRALLKLHILKNISITCKLVKYIYHVSLQLSSWCLVVLTIDRLIAILFVFKYMNWCKRLYSLRILIVIFLLIFLLNIHLIVFRDAKLIDNNNSNKIYKFRRLYDSKAPKYVCNVDATRYPFYYKYFYAKWEMYHSIVYGAIPFLIIFISNISIILKLNVLRKNKSFVFKRKLIKQKPNDDNEVYNDYNENEKANNNENNKIKALNKNLDSCENQSSKRFVQTNTKDPNIRSFQITLMLLAIAVIFLILTGPISVYMPMLYDKIDSKRELIKVILRYIGYTNNAVNFYIYVIFSSEFRREFVNTIKSMFASCGQLKNRLMKTRKQQGQANRLESTTSTSLSSSSTLKSRRSNEHKRHNNKHRRQQQLIVNKTANNETKMNRTEFMRKFREKNESSEPFIDNSKLEHESKTLNHTSSIENLNNRLLSVNNKCLKKNVSTSNISMMRQKYSSQSKLNNSTTIVVMKKASNNSLELSGSLAHCSMTSKSISAYSFSNTSNSSSTYLTTIQPANFKIRSNNEYILKNNQVNVLPNCPFINTRSSLV